MSKFILSCTTTATRVDGKDEILECFRNAKKWGYSYWGLQGPWLWTRKVARWLNTDLLNKLAGEAGLVGCTEVYGPQFPTESPEAAEEAAEDMSLIFEVAERMNCPYAVFSGATRREGGIEATIAGLKKMLPMVKDRPVKLGLEPHYHTQINFIEDYDAVFDAIDDPQVGITIDTGHFHAAGVDWKALIRKYPDRIYNIHLKDHIGAQSVAIGAGEVDLRGLIEELHAIDYNGALGLELEVEDPENLPRYCVEARTYMDKLVKEVTGEAAI